MTDEEMAEEWVKDHSGLIGSFKFVKYDYDSMEQAYLAGLKAGRPVWHDLRKDPKDLPKEAGYILSPVLLLMERLKGTSCMSYSLGKYNFSEREFEFAHLKDVEEVIAWCEIPTFKE